MTKELWRVPGVVPVKGIPRLEDVLSSPLLHGRERIDTAVGLDLVQLGLETGHGTIAVGIVDGEGGEAGGDEGAHLGHGEGLDAFRELVGQFLRALEPAERAAGERRGAPPLAFAALGSAEATVLVAEIVAKVDKPTARFEDGSQIFDPLQNAAVAPPLLDERRHSRLIAPDRLLHRLQSWDVGAACGEFRQFVGLAGENAARAQARGDDEGGQREGEQDHGRDQQRQAAAAPHLPLRFAGHQTERHGGAAGPEQGRVRGLRRTPSSGSRALRGREAAKRWTWHS